MLRIDRGRDQGALRCVFTALGTTRCAARWKRLIYVNGRATEILAHCPAAKVVYDYFHIVAIDDREVIDRINADETNLLGKRTGPGSIRDVRRVIKGARWLLPRNRRSTTTTAERVPAGPAARESHAQQGLRAQGGPEPPQGLALSCISARLVKGVVAVDPQEPNPRAE